MPSAPANRRVVLVLGMHRSGTSALSHAVHLLGAGAPATLMPPGPDNPRGFWESAVVASLNDEILAAGGSGWADWQRFEPARIPLLDGVDDDAVAAFDVLVVSRAARVPMTADTVTTTKPTRKEMRAPYTTREKMSRPSLSVPKRW